jgi:NAD(P)H-nitrite reductase large subunit
MTAMDPSPIIFERCTCTGVTRATVVQALAERGCRTVEDIQRETGACTGCRTCRPELELLLKEQGVEPSPRPPVSGMRPGL